MKNLYIFLLCIIVLPQLLLSQSKEEYKQALKNRDKYLFAARPVQKKFVKTIPFDFSQKEILIQVVIAGETYNFMFDTGAATIISDELKQKLNLKPIFTNKMIDGQGTVNEEAVYNLSTLETGGITFTNVATIAADLAKFEEQFCLKIDGIFGTNVMRTCRWKIDYSNKLLTFSDSKIKPGKDATAIKFTENFSGSPEIKFYMAEYNFMVMMDTRI